MMLQGPEGKYLFGVVKVGAKGQIVIPKAARDKYGIKPGDQLPVGGDENGIAIFTNSQLVEFLKKTIIEGENE